MHAAVCEPGWRRRVRMSASPPPHRHAIWPSAAGHLGRALIVAGAVAILAAVVTALPGAYDAIRGGVSRLGHGDRRWIALAVGFEALSFLGHMSVPHRLRGPLVAGRLRRQLRDHMAGHAATRLFGAAGAGGIAVTVWAPQGGAGGRSPRACPAPVCSYSLYAVPSPVDRPWTDAAGGGGWPSPGAPVCGARPGGGAWPAWSRAGCFTRPRRAATARSARLSAARTPC